MKNSSKLQVLEFIEDNLPPESATAFGLYINAELGFQRREANYVCTLLMLLQPREAIQEGGLRVEERAKIVLDEVLERLPEVRIWMRFGRRWMNPRLTQWLLFRYLLTFASHLYVYGNI